MTVLLVMAVSLVVLFGGGKLYSSFIARQLGEDPSRPTPAVAKADGRDFVPTPTPVVFAHHFASIAGAGPILGPVIAVIYGWVPALLWVLFGGVLIGAVHDYLATYMATREGGSSIATIARRVIGKDAFIAITIFLVVILALVCAAFLNASATALSSMLPFGRLDLPADQTLFRVEEGNVVIGGIASMSVICITAVAPLIGWMYIKKKVSVWVCSALAVAICAASITVGLFLPVRLDPDHWKFLLSAYVLIAAGVPVWIFLQSRDFINVHILYVGMLALLATLVVAGFRGAGVTDLYPTESALPAMNIGEGTQALGMFWPGLFIVIACGAVSGFHSLCAGGTTCKQLTNEKATRQIGYNGMLLESFLAACVIAVMMLGAAKAHYIQDVHPVALLGLEAKPNWVLGFAIAVGNAGKLAWGVPIAAGALAGMVLLEGFLVTTLDTAIRLTRYLIEEVWKTLFAKYDVFAEAGAEQRVAQPMAAGEDTPAGTGGIPAAPPDTAPVETPARPKQTRGALRGVLLVLRQYWVNSALAVGMMLAFALTGGQKALWQIFASSNQLLASMVLGIASLWLLRRGKTIWFAFVPAVLMLVTTLTKLVLMLKGFLADPGKNVTLLTADILILVITTYLLIAAARATRRFFARRRAQAPVA